MSAETLVRAKQDALEARRRLERSLAETRERLRPGNLAGEAWDGVKDKSASLADEALDAVKQRPATVSLALGAVALFLARAPLKRAVGGLISKEPKKAGTARKGKRSPAEQGQGAE